MAGESSETPSYLVDIQPVLASKCYACHGPDASKREAGLRLDIESGLFENLESGNTAVSIQHLPQSEIIRRITSSDPDSMMPPPDFSKPLTNEEIGMITHWVEGGAIWENHWSYEPLTATEPARVSPTGWNKNPIDQFILHSLKRKGLKHSQRADKRTLIRRLTYDLHGLPPAPHAVKAFMEDESEDAYENLVDTLLASPRYGERWARHWLDVVHYGETHGYDKDKRRPNAWPYREYVITALNQDIPYWSFC